MFLLKKWVGFGLLVGAFAAVQAASPVLVPGEYVTAEGWGVLQVRAGQPLHWSIHSLGGNAHICQLEGIWQAGKVMLSDKEAANCHIAFHITPQGINVSDNEDETCRYFCGVRAGYTGQYERPPAACTPSQVRKTRQNFQQAYQRQAYAQAAQLLAPVLAQCERYMTWLDKGWLRNDLGLTQAKLHDKACQVTLAPLAEDAVKSDEVLQSEYAPSDAEAWLRVVKAARTNLKKCAAI